MSWLFARRLVASLDPRPDAQLDIDFGPTLLDAHALGRLEQPLEQRRA